MSDAFYVLDRQWQFVYINKAAEPLLRRTREDLIGKNVWDEFPAAKEASFYTEYERALRDDVTVSMVDYYPEPLDTWFEVTAYPSAEGLSVFFRDITELHSARQALEESERRYRSLFETMSQGVVVLDGDGNFIAANTAAQRMYGLTLEQMQGRSEIGHPWRLIDEHGNDIPLSGRPSIRALRTGKPVYHEVMGIVDAVSSETRWLQATAVPQFRPGESKPYQVNKVLEDITERRNAESERAKAEMELHDVLDRQRSFLRDVLASVTDGRLRLCFSASELPPEADDCSGWIPLSASGGMQELRNAVLATAKGAEFVEARCNDLITAVSEAAMNAIVHAGGGRGRVCRSGDTVRVWIVDEGKGIDVARLPRAALERGYTTAGSFGHGMKIMLWTADRTFLMTGPRGTTLVVEQSRATPEEGLQMPPAAPARGAPG